MSPRLPPRSIQPNRGAGGAWDTWLVQLLCQGARLDFLPPAIHGRRLRQRRPPLPSHMHQDVQWTSPGHYSCVSTASACKLPPPSFTECVLDGAVAGHDWLVDVHRRGRDPSRCRGLRDHFQRCIWLQLGSHPMAVPAGGPSTPLLSVRVH